MASPRDELLAAGFWHGPVDAAAAILAAHPELPREDLYAAAYVGDDDAVRRLIDKDRFAVHERCGPRMAEPLVYLCFSPFLRRDPTRSGGFVRAATALLDAGANANAGFFDESHQPKPEFESVLYGAAGVAHHAALTQLLLERGADPNDAETPYHAPEGYDNGAVRALLESGKLTDASLAVMLLRKADWHDLDGVQLLLDHGAKPNFLGVFKRTPLHHSVLSDNELAIVDLLLDAGGDPRLVADDLRHGGDFRPGRSTMSLAARRGRGDVLASIRRRGFPDETNAAERIIAACARGDGSGARRIADSDGAATGELRREGGTLLAEFAGNDNAAGVDALIAVGVPPDALYCGDPYFGIARDSTALHVAAWRMAHEALERLIQRGANVNARDGKDRTPLMLAVRACVDSYWRERRSPRSIKALLAAGASRTGVAAPTGYAEADRLLA